MKMQTISTPNAPAAIGAYSQAVAVQQAQRLVFCSGQIPIDPRTGELVRGSIEEEAAACMENLKAVLGAAGLTLRSVVRCTIYLTDMNDFAAVNGVYGSYFPDSAPARAAIQVAGLPKGARVEIDAIAAE